MSVVGWILVNVIYVAFVQLYTAALGQIALAVYACVLLLLYINLLVHAKQKRSNAQIPLLGNAV